MPFKADTAKIKRWREERHWSQEHLADAAGVGLRTLQRLEAGQPASKESLKAIAAAYGVDVSALAIDPDAEAVARVRQNNARLRDAIRLSVWIHLAAYGIGMVTFLGISWSAGGPGLVMRDPMIWWTVGLAAHAGTLGIIEAVTRTQDKYPERRG